MINYKIGDLVTRINNSYRAGGASRASQVLVEKTKDNYQIINLLIKLGCLASLTGQGAPGGSLPATHTAPFLPLLGKSQPLPALWPLPCLLALPLGQARQGTQAQQRKGETIGPLVGEATTVLRSKKASPSPKGVGEGRYYTVALRLGCEAGRSIARRASSTTASNMGILNQSHHVQTGLVSPKNKLTLISKPGKRIYVSYKDLKDFNNGLKTYILRTSQGIITSQTAIKLKIGGELLIKL